MANNKKQDTLEPINTKYVFQCSTYDLSTLELSERDLPYIWKCDCGKEHICKK